MRTPLTIGRRSRAKGRSFGIVLTSLLLASAAACASSSPSDSANDRSRNSSVSDGIKARVADLQRGLATQPPEDGPVAQSGKTVWAISCGDFAESCKAVTDANIDAGRELGWSMKRFDAKGDPAKAAEGIRSAIAAGADAIVVSAFDCTLVKGPLQEAKAAGIITYGAGTSNCDDPVLGDGDAPLYTAVDVLDPKVGPAWSNWITEWGSDKAAYVIAKTGGTAKVINIKQTDIPNVELISTGFEDGLDSCSTCSIEATVSYTSGDLASNTLTQKITTALTEHPDATVVHMPVDGLLPFVSPAVNESGRGDQLLVLGGEGYPANVDAIRAGGPQDAALAVDLAWESWAQMDDVNRLFAGDEPVFGGWGYTVVDADDNLPAKGGWESSTDFRSAYRAVWGR